MFHRQGSAHRLVDHLGLLLFAFGVVNRLIAVIAPVNFYDEGLLLTNANLLLLGEVPYLDFYSNYPPGVPLALALLFALFGPSTLPARALGVVLQVGLAVLAGRLAGRIVGRRFVWLAAGLVLLWLEPLRAIPFAYVAAMAMGLLAVSTLTRAHEPDTPGGWLLGGAALGAVSFLRHDLFVLSCISLGLAALLAAGRVGRARRAICSRAGAAVLTGMAGVVVACWLPVFVLAGRQVLDDLYFDQVQYVLPARILPLPRFFARSSLGWPWPTFAIGAFPAALVLAWLAVPAFAAVAAMRRSLSAQGRRLALGVGALGIAALPHTLGRVDLPHALYAVPPSLVLLSALIDRRLRAAAPVRPSLRSAAGRAATALGLLWLIVPPLTDAWPILSLPARQSLPRAPFCSDGKLAERRVVLAYVAAHTGSEDRVFIGLFRHDRLTINEIDLYFHADRRGATRILQFDPNVVTRADVQAGMIAEIERARAKVVVLTNTRSWTEPNMSQEPGSTLLDEYLARAYSVALGLPNYRVLQRRPGSGGGAANADAALTPG